MADDRKAALGAAVSALALALGVTHAQAQIVPSDPKAKPTTDTKGVLIGLDQPSTASTQIKGESNQIKGESTQIKGESSQIKSMSLKFDSNQVKGAESTQIKGAASNQIKGTASSQIKSSVQLKATSSQIKQ